VVAFNPEETSTSYTLKTKGEKQLKVTIDAQALQTIVLR
jgi:hypothetical protein